VRAFLAIPVLPPALETYQELRAALTADVPAVRWTPQESPHITLHFFGAIDEHLAELAVGVLRPLIAAQPALRLRLRGLGVFPPHGRPRVLWSGVDEEGNALLACARECRQTLADAGFPVEDRPYRPHCTLGRPREPWPARARECWERHVQRDPATPLFTADRTILYESLAGPAGVRHVPREVMPLRAA
jgi:RNA 2',3'-cyclic 3'-phosphodiesterase